MRRLYLLLPDAQSAKDVVATLEQQGISRHHVHAVARYGTVLEDLPKATILQTSRARYAMGIGATLGGLAGLVGGLLAVAYPPPGLTLGELTAALCALAGAGAGALVSLLVGRDITNPEVLPFEGDILRGRLLLMVDVPRHEADTLLALFAQQHPEIDVKAA